jgi:antirestriction protein
MTNTSVATGRLVQPAGVITDRSGSMPNPGIYVTGSSKVTGGSIVFKGAWINLARITTVDEIQKCIDWILAKDDASYWEIHDSCGLPNYLNWSKRPSLEDLAAYATGLAENLTDQYREAYLLVCQDQAKAVTNDDFDRIYQSYFDSEPEFAKALAEERGVIQEDADWPHNCINWEEAWRKLTYEGYRSEPCSAGGVHIFHSY